MGSRRGAAAVSLLLGGKQLLHRDPDTSNVQAILPLSARTDRADLTIGGVPARALAEEHGTPLLVYCEETLRAQARAYAEAAPGALVVYGTKAFANVAILRVLAEEGVGADVATLGELAFARKAGIAASLERPQAARRLAQATELFEQYVALSPQQSDQQSDQPGDQPGEPAGDRPGDGAGDGS